MKKKKPEVQEYVGSLLLRKDLKKMVPLSETTTIRMEKAGLFPKRRRLSPNRVAWVRKEVEEWIQARLEQKP